MTNCSNVTRHLILFLAILAQGSLLGFAQRGPSEDLPHCSDITLSGGYGYIVNGTTHKGEQYSLVGRFVADGKGRMTGNGVQSVNGAISRPTFSGTYTVNANCTGMASLMFHSGGFAPLEFIIVDNGSMVDIIVAGANGDQGENEVGTATRQFNKPIIP